jgi:hypothetical protein
LFGENLRFEQNGIWGTLQNGTVLEGINWYTEDSGQIVLHNTGAVPEPSTLVTFSGLLGMGLIGYWRRRRKQ